MAPDITKQHITSEITYGVYNSTRFRFYTGMPARVISWQDKFSGVTDILHTSHRGEIIQVESLQGRLEQVKMILRRNIFAQLYILIEKSLYVTCRTHYYVFIFILPWLSTPSENELTVLQTS